MSVTARPGRAERIGWPALAVRSFRILFGVSLATNTAAFMLSAGINWSALEASGTSAGVAVVGFCFALPYTLLTLHAGLLTDRFGGRRLLAISLALSGCATVALGVGEVVADVPYIAIAAGALVIGTLSVIGSPASMTLANDLVPAGLVPSAMTLVWLAVNVGRVAGGAIAGLTLARFPGGVTLAIAGLVSALAALPIARLPAPAPVRPDHPATDLIGPIRAAASHAFRDPSLATLFALTTCIGVLGLAFNYQLPVVARELDAGANGFGVLVAAVGIGGLAAGSVAVRLMRRAGTGRVVMGGVAAIAVGLVGCGLSGSLPVAAVSMALAGGGFAIFGATTLALILALGSPAYRGRLTALFSLLYWGLMPVGAIVGGMVASATGARTTLAIFGLAIAVAGAGAVALRRGVVTMRIGADGRVEGARPARPA